MKNIPLELLRPIIEHLDDDSQSLLAVSLASRVLRVEGQRILFRTMTLLKDKEAHIKFLTVVTSSSMLAQLVEEYWQFDLLDVDHEQEPLWRLTCRGLNAMVNLKHLFFSTLSGRPCAQILRGCTFQLEVLRWENHDDAEQLLEFLPSQPHLRTLGVEWKNPELITSGICPGLQVLHGNQGAINAFLPGRSITSLKWSPDQMESSDGPINHLSQEFHHIRFFSFGGYFGRPPLSFIIPQLPLLEVLELIGLHSFEELQWISQISRLRVFILSNHWRGAWGGLLSIKERENHFPKLFVNCKNLQHIDINTEPQRYQRWLRDGSSCRYLLGVDEVLLPCWNIS